VASLLFLFFLVASADLSFLIDVRFDVVVVVAQLLRVREDLSVWFEMSEPQFMLLRWRPSVYAREIEPLSLCS